MEGYGSGRYGVDLYGVVPIPPTVSTAYTTGAYGTQVVLWRADRLGRKIEPIPTRIPVQGTIEFNDDREVKRSLSLDVNDPTYLTPFRDALIPEIILTNASGVMERADMGVYIVTPPSTQLTTSQYKGSIEGQDITWVLANDAITGMEVIPAGTDTGQAAREIALAILPANRLNLPDTGVSLASDMVIEAGTSRLKAMSDLYGAATWYAPYSEGSGIITSTPYLDYRYERANRHYSSQSRDVTIVPPLNETPEWGRIVNRVVVRNISPSTDDPIFAVAEVTDPESPVHPSNLGTPDNPMVLSRVVDDPQIPDQQAAQAKANALLAEGASWYRRATIRTVVDIHAGSRDIIDLDVHEHGAAYTGLWRRRTWAIHLRGLTSLTESEIVRTEAWGA